MCERRERAAAGAGYIVFCADACEMAAALFYRDAWLRGSAKFDC